ncbi:MAG: tryptophan synthase subunit alpha [Eubacterium sp.]
MSRISDAFKKGKTFIPFITGGDGGLDTTQKLILEMQDAGADIIEIGIPFSDPIAEGPVIQEADLRALTAGTTTDKLMDAIKEIKEDINVPLIFMTYVNAIFKYGSKKFMDRCVECGISGVIVPDCPFEEREEIAPFCKEAGIDLIPLVAPTSKERIKAIAKSAEGYVYVVSSLGVTGVRDNITTDLGAMTTLVKEATKVPCAIGFGISTPQQAENVCKYADGVIVGSAIVKIIAQYGKDCVPYVGEYVRSMKAAIK